MPQRVVVVGSGVAGLTAALECARSGHEVTLVTKSAAGESNSLYAQGGIAAALFDDDSVESHIADTLVAGAGLADPWAVRILCEEGPERVRELLRLGAAFDRAPDGSLARGLEGAHSVARVLHGGGDATGRTIVAALLSALRESRVTVIEHVFLRDIRVAAGTVAGVGVIDAAGDRVISAEAVIIATGGAGQLYRHTTNPAGATGDGVAAALRAGARVIDAEFVQFHPTALAVPGTPLVSEALRGEGAALLTSTGERFMLGEHPDAELAPRDVVARAIARQMERQGGAPVLLDARRLGGTVLSARFPGFVALAKRHGLDPANDVVPVTPAAHYWMGGLEVDEHARTSVRGLFAVGEASCTRAHGANRLASNSLLEALVTGHRAARAVEGAWRTSLSAAQAPDRPGTVAVTRPELHDIMWRHAGLERTADGLAAASAFLRAAVVPGDTITDLETANLLLLARTAVAAASARTESIGAHHRSDEASARPSHERKGSLVC